MRTLPTVIEISRVNATFEREPFRTPYGFKGGYVSRLWQPITYLESVAGNHAVGLGTQSVLWSDPAVFASHSEDGGNALMFAVAEYAMQLAAKRAVETPIQLLDEILPATYDYARKITGRPDLRKTFVLNALVSLDIAAWILFAHENALPSFDEMLPAEYRAALSHRHDQVASIPVVGYGSSPSDMSVLADEGYFVIKVKLGHPGHQSEMLEQDMRRIEEVHRVFKDRETSYTETGRIPYYFDINGRYEEIDTLQRLLDHADAIGVLERIVVVEEPFPESYEADVSQLGVRLAADESAHTDADARKLMDMGYGAIALKPVAKTVSMTLKIAAEAHRRGVSCFCADLTVNPILVDWNKSFAARLPPLPGLEVGLLETNGHQFYRNWDRLKTFHPRAGSPWTIAEEGVFNLNDEFFKASAGILENSEHYLNVVSPPS